MISIIGYENLLAFVFLEGVPLLGCQTLKMRIIDVENNLEIMKEVNVPLTPNCKLTWIGFTEEGLILS